MGSRVRSQNARLPPHLCVRADPLPRVSTGAHENLARLVESTGLDRKRLVDIALRTVTADEALAQHAEDVQDVSAWLET